MTNHALFHTGIFVIALFVLLIIGAIAYRQIGTLRTSANLVSHTHAVNIELGKLLSYVNDAETGMRGFVVTGDSSFLQQYIHSDKVISQSTNRLMQLTIDDREKYKNLDTIFELIGLRLTIMAQSLRLAKNFPTIGEEVHDQMLKGKQVMDQIREAINHQIDQEITLINERENKYRSDINFAPYTYMVLILFAMGIFIFSYLKIKRDQITLKISNDHTILINNELSKQNTIFAHAEKAALIGNLFWNTKTGEISCSENLFRLLDSGPDHFTPTLENFLNFVHPEDRESARKDAINFFESGNKNLATYRIISKQGQVKYIRPTLRTLDHNHEQVIIGTFQDVTSDILMNEKLSNKHAELEEVENRYHRMVNEVQDYAIILLNEEGIIQNWNKGAEQIKGYHEAEIVGKSFSVFYPKEDQERHLPQQFLEEARSTGRAAHEGWRVRKNGTKFWGSVVITALHNQHNAIVGFTKVTRDLSDRKRAEELDLQRRKIIEDKNAELQMINQELASFNHIASHDLQEPLRKIQTFISKIQQDDLDRISEKGKEYFSRVRISANRMQQLISDLLIYSHIYKNDKLFVTTDLNSILAKVLEELSPTLDEKKADLKIGDLPTLKVIAFQFEQLFTNIIENALKYSKPGVIPEIRISSSVVNAEDIPETNGSKDGKYYKITISDNGIGFDPKYTSTIFTLFQRLHDKTEYAGTGIGLSICKKIVENHNGLISAESNLNEGASFHIYIPYQAT